MTNKIDIINSKELLNFRDIEKQIKEFNRTNSPRRGEIFDTEPTANDRFFRFIGDSFGFVAGASFFISIASTLIPVVRESMMPTVIFFAVPIPLAMVYAGREIVYHQDRITRFFGRFATDKAKQQWARNAKLNQHTLEFYDEQIAKFKKKREKLENKMKEILETANDAMVKSGSDKKFVYDFDNMKLEIHSIDGTVQNLTMTPEEESLITVLSASNETE